MKKNLNSQKLLVDVLLLTVMLASNLHKLAGDAIHEWIGIVCVPILFWHLLLNWDWLVAGCRKIFGRLPGIVRFNFLWDSLLYFILVGTVFSGILISRNFLGTFGVSVANDPFMSMIHRQFSAWLVVLLGIHLGVHYRWIFSVLRGRGGKNNGSDSAEKIENAERKEAQE